MCSEINFMEGIHKKMTKGTFSSVKSYFNYNTNNINSINYLYASNINLGVWSLLEKSNFLNVFDIL